MTYNEALEAAHDKLSYIGENTSKAEIDRIMRAVIADAFCGIDTTDFYYIRDVVWQGHNSVSFRAAICVSDYVDRFLKECYLFNFLKGVE